jgi:hypothetical protein
VNDYEFGHLQGKEWKRYLAYYCGELPEEELLQLGERSKAWRCRGHFAIGLTRLAEGDREGARKHFRQAAETRLMSVFSRDWASTFLARMEQDSRWPPWILLKQKQPKP